MNYPGNISQSDIIHSLRLERAKEVFGGEFNFLTNVHTPKDYHESIMMKTLSDVVSGKLEGRRDMATASGKTYLSMCLMHHIVKNGGKVLYLTPGNVELNNAIDSHVDKYKLGENNFIKFEQESDITSIKIPRYKELYDSVPYHYGNIQMLIYDERHKHIPMDYYDLIVYDESQGFLGDIYSSTMRYFLGVGLYMSATPFNQKRHLGSIIPHQYGEVTSDYLEKKHGHPKAEIIACKVEENGDSQDIPTGDEDFDFERNENHRSMINISERFRISEAIYEEIIISGDRKGIDFMPTVDDAEIFVKYIVPNNPILRGKVDFVAGRRGKKKNDEIEKKFRNGELKVVLCKDLWNRSLDVPDVTDIILNDPTRSEERLTQRIGRARRKHPGKSKFRIWDVISSFFHSAQAGKAAISAEDVIPQAGKRKVQKKSVSAGPREVSPDFIAALQRRRIDSVVGITKHEVEFRENLRQAYFLGDTSMATEVFINFATKVFHVHPHELQKNWSNYLKKNTVLTIDFNGESIRLNFQDFSDALKFYNTYSDIAEYNWLEEISENTLGATNNNLHKKVRELRSTSITQVESILEKNDISRGIIKLYKGKSDGRYISALNLYLQKHGGTIEWIERHYEPNNFTPSKFSFIVKIHLFGEDLEFDTGKFADSKKEARHFIAQEIFTEHLHETLQGQEDRIDTIEQSLNKRLELNNFLMVLGGSMKYIQTERNTEMHIKHTLEIKVQGEDFWYKDELYFPKTSQAQEHLATKALKELKEKYKLTPQIKAQKSHEISSQTQREKKSPISLIYELMQKNRGDLNIHETEVGVNEAGVKLFTATIDLRVHRKNYPFSSEGSFTRKETARENVAEIAYQELKPLLPKIEEYLIPKKSSKQNPHTALSIMQQKVNEGGKLNAKDIHTMRQVKPGSSRLTYWWLLQFMFRKGLITAPRVTERPGYVFISIDGNNMGTCAKKRDVKNRKPTGRGRAKQEIEHASEITINKLLQRKEIQDYFVRKLRKQIGSEKA